MTYAYGSFGGGQLDYPVKFARGYPGKIHDFSFHDIVTRANSNSAVKSVQTITYAAVPADGTYSIAINGGPAATVTIAGKTGTELAALLLAAARTAGNNILSATTLAAAAAVLTVTSKFAGFPISIAVTGPTLPTVATTTANTVASFLPMGCAVMKTASAKAIRIPAAGDTAALLEGFTVDIDTLFDVGQPDRFNSQYEPDRPANIMRMGKIQVMCEGAASRILPCKLRIVAATDGTPVGTSVSFGTNQKPGGTVIDISSSCKLDDPMDCTASGGLVVIDVNRP